MFGCAHGVAGIAWVMAFLQSYVPDKRYKNYLDQLAKTIVWTAIFDPATRTVTWPVSERNSLTWNAWCHGGPGILKGLIAISGHCDLPTESWGLRDVARTMIRSRFDSFSLCHGYASALDAVSDLFDAGRGMDRVVRREALVVRDTMVESCPTLAARPHPEGIRSMGLMTGLGGVVRTLARLNRTLARCNRMLP
jgi:lantibiotic modifying enzyme